MEVVGAAFADEERLAPHGHAVFRAGDIGYDLVLANTVHTQRVTSTRR